MRGRTRVRNNVHEYDNIIICHRNEEEKQNVTNSEIYKNPWDGLMVGEGAAG